MVRDREFYMTMLRIALPIALQSFLSFLVVIADDIMVSSTSHGLFAQAAVAQVNSITALFTATMTGLIAGSSVLIAQYWGRKDMERIKRIFAVVMWICIIVSLAVVALMKLFPETIVGIVINRNDIQITDLALEYLAIICFSYVPFAISTALVGMLRTIEVVKITMYAALHTLVVNIGLNYILIFGKLGFPALGVRGAAIATLLARISEMILVGLYAFYIQKEIELKPRDFLVIDRTMLKDYSFYGLPVGITDAQWALIGMLKAAIIGQLGGVFMAANSIANSMANLGTLFTFGLAGGAAVVVGKAVGRGDYQTAREYSKTIQIMFFGVGLVMAGLVFLLRVPFVSLYGSSSNPEVYGLSVQLIAILAVTMIGTTYHASCFVGINRGAGDSRFVAMVDMICGWFVVLPLTLLAAFVWNLPLPMVFLATRIDQCFKWIIAFFRLRGNKWIKNVTRESSVS
ncbi:MAG: MATE family efflux transporter [Firmicutes bacterium]|nr:MATE family efflux transporter [Bacillota bacterium]